MTGHDVRLGQDDLERLLPAALDDVVQALGSADLGAPVDGCPGWRVHELAEHLGGVQRWAAAALRAGDPDAGPPEVGPDPSPGDLRDREAVLARARRDAAALLDALRTAGPAAPAWTFGPRPRTSAFWWRRMVHEATLHTWDVRAAGRAEARRDPPWTVSDDPLLALDGVDEVVTMFFPRQVRTGRCAPPVRTLRVHPDEDAHGPGWLLAGDGTGETRDGDRPADVTLRGPADTVLLALWKRVPPGHEQLWVEGDPALAAGLLSLPLVP